jgi:hypothetical protein
MVLCLLNWLVPGAGYIAVKDVARGVTLFVVINLCFAIGLMLGGYILEPASWRPLTPQFNLVGVLTYLSQAFHGGGWLLLRFLQDASADTPQAFFNIEHQAARTYADLGAFHLVAAGALNYFATVRLYDLLAGTPELSASAPSSEANPKPDLAEAEK